MLETTLGTIVDDIAEAGLDPPAIVCVGQSVLMRQALDWQALAAGEPPRNLDPLGTWPPRRIRLIADVSHPLSMSNQTSAGGIPTPPLRDELHPRAPPRAAARPRSRSACCAPSTPRHAVRGAKSGPDYIDPRFHEAACGQPCPNLDAWAMTPGRIKRWPPAPTAADLKARWVCSTARRPTAKARPPTSPVCSVYRWCWWSMPAIWPRVRRAAWRGFSGTTRRAVAGVILNKVGSPRHEAMLRRALCRWHAGARRAAPQCRL